MQKNPIHDGEGPGTVEKDLSAPLVHNDQDGAVVSAAKSLTTAYRRSSEKLSDARDLAVEVGKHNPVATGFSVLVAGFGCGIGCGILFSNWMAGRRRDKSANGSNQAGA